MNVSKGSSKTINKQEKLSLEFNEEVQKKSIKIMAGLKNIVEITNVDTNERINPGLSPQRKNSKQSRDSNKGSIGRS